MQIKQQFLFCCTVKKQKNKFQILNVSYWFNDKLGEFVLLCGLYFLFCHLCHPPVHTPTIPHPILPPSISKKISPPYSTRPPPLPRTSNLSRVGCSILECLVACSPQKQNQEGYSMSRQHVSLLLQLLQAPNTIHHLLSYT